MCTTVTENHGENLANKKKDHNNSENELITEMQDKDITYRELEESIKSV